MEKIFQVSPRSYSSYDFHEDSELSPIKTPRKAFSPTQLIKQQIQKQISEQKVPHLAIHLEPASVTNPSSWSSFTSLDEKLIDIETLNKKKDFNDKQQKSDRSSFDDKDPTINLKNVMSEVNNTKDQSGNSEKNNNKHQIDPFYSDSCKETKKFEPNISKPKLISHESHFKKAISLNKTNALEKRNSKIVQTPLKIINEEESPLTKLKSIKNYQEKSDIKKEKNVIVFNEISNDSAIDHHPFRNLIFAPNIAENLFKKHLLLTYKGIVYSKKLTQPSSKFLKHRSIKLKDSSNKKKVLFMDLDETLIHSCHIKENPEIILDIRDENSIKKIGFNIRPFCTEFLEKTSKFFEIYVFTASSELYSKNIIEKIDPNHRIQQIFNKTNTMNTKNGFIIKDLRIFENRNLKDMIIVDNLSHSFSFQIENGIPLLEWQSDKNDMELKYLFKYLKKFQDVYDVRDLNREYLKLNKLGELTLEDLSL